METNQDVKRPRLDSWGRASSTHSNESHPGAYPSAEFSPQPQYSAARSMSVWDSKAPQLDQQVLLDSRSHSVGGTPMHGHPTPPRLGSYGASAQSGSPIIPQGYSAFHSHPNPHHHLGEQHSDPSQSPATRQTQLKPLQTASHPVFHDPGFYAPHGSLGDPGHSVGPELESPGGSASSLAPGPSPMIPTGAYGPGQSPLSHSANIPGSEISTAVPQSMGAITTYPPRRKAIRAAQACDACRARKAKCDEGRPSCGFCKETHVVCVYREVPPPKQDRTLLQILDRLGRVEQKLDSVSFRLDDPDKLHVKAEDAAGAHIEQSVKPENPLWSDAKNTPPLYDPRPVGPANAAVILQHQREAGTPVEVAIESDDSLTIPYKHTTAAHKLMTWPAIRQLLDNEAVIEENYIIDAEETRAPLWGWQDEDTTELEGDLRVTAENGLKLDRPTASMYLTSFLAEFHALHPILDKATITKDTFAFVDQGLGATREFRAPVPPENTRRTTVARNPPGAGKRKRSTSNTGTVPLQPSASTEDAPRIPNTTHSAVVLLVLALGAISLHRSPIPDAYPQEKQSGDFLPVKGATTTLLEKFEPNNPESGTRTVHMIPGLAYFSKALEILGRHIGKNSLENVQAGLLAGMYWSQLGRVMDSWKWISLACMSCQTLVKMYLDPLDRDPLRKDLILRSFWSCLMLESDVLAELDLPPSGVSRLEDSMEFPIGVEAASVEMEATEADPSIWMYFLAQASLRRLLNRVHTALYKQDTSRLDSMRSFTIAKELDHQLTTWRSKLPEPLQWEDSDPPSDDVNAARLRAKYYGARYIIHRPFVCYVLHRKSGSASLFTTLSPLSGNEASQRNTPVTATPPVASSGGTGTTHYGSEERVGLSSDTLELNCRTCLQSAVSSTTAFHAFDPDTHRPIITNVLGTAHAQFGNLLVLQAAYYSPVLRPLVNPQLLVQLLDTTLHWFKSLLPIVPALQRDIEILEIVSTKLDLNSVAKTY